VRDGARRAGRAGFVATISPDDRLAFTWGRVATIRRAATPLRLVA
jgi:hypothetical protein